jgi:hypothetical protein
MRAAHDPVITKQIRAILMRRWIDIRGLAYGSVNGVAYVRGALRRNPLFPAPADTTGDAELKLLHVLDRDLRAIAGVKDVVFEMDGFEHRGDHWERTTRHTATSATSGRA